VIREATEHDAAALVDLWRAAGLEFAAGDVPAELGSALRLHPGLVLVAEDEAGLAASVFGTYDGRRGWVNRLATRPDRRGQGLASRLLGTLEARLIGLGCRKVNLLIEPGNRDVMSFYRRHGYAPDDLEFMEKWLTAAPPPADTP
jgi:GNAT superfamily N-acetyltransferase